MKTLSRQFGSAANLVLLAPELSEVPGGFLHVEFDGTRHLELMSEMQRMRGSVYLSDGAIEPWQLTEDGRHQTPWDPKSWHLLALTDDGAVCGCARYLEHGTAASFERMGVATSALAQSDKFGQKLQAAILAEMDTARRRNMAFVEVGGWALSETLRCTTEGLKIALSAYGLARHLGGCIGVTTATVRHCSASILRKIGGRQLVADGIELPTYYDPAYKCEMVILRFDSTAPNPRYLPWIDDLESCLAAVPVVCGGRSVPNWRTGSRPAIAPDLTADAA